MAVDDGSQRVMATWAEHEELRTDQYKDDTKLAARQQLHERFSVNPQGLRPWLFHNLELRGNARILDVGCGNGRLWEEHRDEISPEWQIAAVDFSRGMVETWRDRLGPLGKRFACAMGDAVDLPFRGGRFDTVLALHMLYHVPDIDRALREIKRVLRPGGRLYASTNGPSHMRELFALAAEVQLVSAAERSAGLERAFGVATGKASLERHFPSVEMLRYDDALEVTEAEPVVQYVASVFDANERAQVGALQQLGRRVQAAIDERGSFRISKEPVLFVASAE